ACNTVTTLCIDILRKEYPFPIVGTEPALSLAKGVSAVLATKATLTSERFFELKRRKRDAFLVPIVPDRWVEKVERSPFAPQIGKEECFFPWADTVVLGCTHFLYLKPLFGTQCVVDGNEGVARRLAFLLSAGQKPALSRKRLKKAGMRNHLLFFLNNKVKRTNVRKKYPKITYLGSGKERNRSIYEQMFVKKRLNFG
ncbi:MAG: glutamate racemase, partial [Christensenellaceae bacterium]